MPVEPLFGAKDQDETQTLPNTAARRGRDVQDEALSRQRADWLKGIRIPIADRLQACGAVADPLKAAELIYHEFVLQRECGEATDWDGLLRDFPEYAAQLQRFREADEIVESALATSSGSTTALCGYDLLEEVGRGGMGVVYRAREHDLDRTVAIKRIREGTLADEETIERFLKEAKAVSRLNHPNIVHIYCVGDCEGEPFIALEFVEGPTLGERIGGTPLVPRLAATLGAAIARAIQHAHEHGIIHRDLKPANILLSGAAERPVPKVTDFGAAKELDQPTRGGRTEFLGTPSYMAPEQVDLQWGAIGQLTDVYGIGALLYEALTGRPPFRADSIGQTLRQVVETQPVSPRLLNPAIPRDLETVCLKCLQKEPQRRYDSAAALADDLERFLAGQPIHARPVGPATRTWMWCRRRPGIAILAAALALAVLAGLGGVALQWRRAEAARKSALASDVEAQQLLSELIQSILLVPGRGYPPVAPSIDSLLKAEAHCKNLLRKNPRETPVRIALTKVYGSLATLYWQRGETAKADVCLNQARSLWEPLVSEFPSDPVCRDWLANTFCWQRPDDVPRFLQSIQRAGSIWFELAEEQPDNLDLMQKIWGCRAHMTGLLSARVHRDLSLLPLEQSRVELERLVRQSPADRTLRKRLAWTCYFLGELYAGNSWAAKASSAWRESYDHYNILEEKGRDDLLNDISLAMSCSRLIQSQLTDAYYVRAVPLLEQVGRRVKALVQKEPQNGWLRELLLEDYCCLALCHGRAGQTTRAVEASDACVKLIAAPLDMERIEPVFALKHAANLLTVGQLLRQAKQCEAALRLVRQASALCSQLAVYPPHDLGFLHGLGETFKGCSALANQLGEPAMSLELADSGRRTVEEWIRTGPDDFRRQEALVTAWERIAKARWNMGEHDQALAAFRTATAIQKKLFDREPSYLQYRASLSKYYDRLVFFGCHAGDLRGAAKAILERTKLWPDDANQMVKSADDFRALADQVTSRSQGHLSRDERAERDRYLAESHRIRQASEAASRHAVHDLHAER